MSYLISNNFFNLVSFFKATNLKKDHENKTNTDEDKLSLSNCKKDKDIFDQIIYKSKPKTVIIIGTHEGYSCMQLLNNIDKQTQVYALDDNYDFVNIVAENLSNMNPTSQIQLLYGDIHRLLSNLVLSGVTDVDIVILNSYHNNREMLAIHLSDMEKLKIITIGTQVILLNENEYILSEKFLMNPNNYLTIELTSSNEIISNSNNNRKIFNSVRLSTIY